MKNITRTGMLALGLFCWVSGALAQDDLGKVSEADFAACQKLRYASALADARRTFARTAPAKAAVKADWEKALQNAGWTEERYREASGTLGDAIQALADIEKGGEDGQLAEENIKAMDPTTVATARAHRKEHTPSDELRARAQKQVREDGEAERRGSPPDMKSLEGKWVYDLDATLELIAAGEKPETKKKLRDQMGGVMTGASYTFGPGDKIVSVVVKDGTPRTDTGTYRLEGSQIFLKGESRRREQAFGIGLKDGQLRLGTMGIYSVFRRE